MRLISTTEAADRLGVTTRRIVALIADGRLPAQKVGRDYVINEQDLKLVKTRKPGRPRQGSKPEGRGKRGAKE